MFVGAIAEFQHTMGIGKEIGLMDLKIAGIDDAKFPGSCGKFGKAALAVGSGRHCDDPFAVGGERRSGAVTQANGGRAVGRTDIDHAGFAAGFAGFIKRYDLAVVADIPRDCPVVPAEIGFRFCPRREANHASAPVVPSKEDAALF